MLHLFLGGIFPSPVTTPKKWGLRLFWSSGRLAPDPLDFGRTLLSSRDPTFLFCAIVFVCRSVTKTLENAYHLTPTHHLR